MNTPFYIYNDKLWKRDLTASDNDSFFHSVFGTRPKESHAYFDKHAKFRRMRWSTFLTYFENEAMPPILTNALEDCLSAYQRLKPATEGDETLFKTYVSGIMVGELPIGVMEIPVIATLENVQVVVLSHKNSSPLTFKPNHKILGNYPHLFEDPKQVVLALEGNSFSRLRLIDENLHPKINKNVDTISENTTNENERHPEEYDRGGSAGTKGVEFQINLLTIFLLNALQKLKNWRLSTENKQAGKFDDIVLEELSDKTCTLVQAKHKENKKITFDQLISVNSKNNDFSLAKYFFSYQQIKSTFKIKAVIICTNTDVDKKSLSYLNRHSVSPESMLHYENGSCFFFTFNDSILSSLKRNIKIYYKNNLQSKNIDEAIITEENIKDFLGKLQLYCNYPAEKNIQVVVEQMLSHMKYSNNLWTRTSSQDLHHKVMAWFKQRKGEYLTEDRAKSIFCEIRSDKYCEVLEYYNIIFERNDFEFTDSEKVIHVIVKDGYLLHAIKIYRALQDYKSKLLYINPDDSVEIQRQIIDAFEFPTYTFLIFIWPAVIQESVEREMCEKLENILERYKYKKLILLSEWKLTQRLKVNNNCVYIEGSVAFEDLSKDTQDMLLQKKNIVFQGVDVSLEELSSAGVIENYQEAICPTVLEKLVCDENIKLGTKLQFLGDNVARYYIDRQFKRQDKWTDQIFTVETICDVSEKVIVISDSAGMGKSTVLTKLATTVKNNNPYLWVIRVELEDYIPILRDTVRDNREAMDVMELLNYKDSTKVSSDFEKLIFSTKENVVLMLDGVDEISPDYAGLVIGLIAQCKEAHNFAKIFVTTRPHMSHELEDALQVDPFIFQPFTKQDQVDFLTRYWMLNLGFDDSDRTKCEHYAETLITKMSSWIKLYRHRENHFAAIPLHVRMLAEIFQENNHSKEPTDWDGCKEHLLSNQIEPRLPSNMNITKLYQIFIQKKRDVFIDRGNPNGNIVVNQALLAQFDECHDFHRALALTVILDWKYKLFSCYRECNKRIKLNSLKIGIVQKFGKSYNFVHRTFAEYFVAESILSELQQNQHTLFLNFLIEEILSHRQYNVVRTFLDNLLQNVVESLPSNIFENYKFVMYEIDLGKRRKYNLIHQMAAEGCSSILQLIFKCIDFNAPEETGNLNIYEVDFVKGNETKIFSNTLSIIRTLIQRDGVNIKDDSGKTPLHYACQNGHVETARNLIKRGADANIRDTGDSTPLHEAARGNHLDVVKLLIEQGADIQAEDRLGHTVLYDTIIENKVTIASYILETVLERNGVNVEDVMIAYTAAYLGKLDVLGSLLEQGVNVNSRTGNDESLIFGATRGGQLGTIEYLIQKGAGVNDKDEDGNTALHLASLRGKLETVTYLVRCGADVNIVNSEGRTALHTAASYGQLDMVEFLVHNGADTNIRDGDGYTPLYLAAEEGFLHTLEFLVDHGAKVNITDKNLRTALFSAVEQGELDAVKFLVGRGADINIRDRDGCTALFLAAEDGEVNTVRCLVEYEADVRVKNNSGQTALHLAVESFRHLDTVKFLVEKCGADVDTRDNSGCTALFSAIKEGNFDAVRFLVDVGADVDVIDEDNRTALHVAVSRCQPEILKLLVEHGAQLNVKTRDGWSAFHLAAAWGHLDTIKLLVEYGADFNERLEDGRTALFLAVEECHLDLIYFFIVELEMDINAKNQIGSTVLHMAALSGVTGTVKMLTELGANINVRNSEGYTAETVARKNNHLHLLKYLETGDVKARWTSVFCLDCLR